MFIYQLFFNIVIIKFKVFTDLPVVLTVHINVVDPYTSVPTFFLYYVILNKIKSFIIKQNYIFISNI